MPKSRQFLFLGILFVLLASCRSRTIVLKPTGVSDKPLPTIVLYTKTTEKKGSNTELSDVTFFKFHKIDKRNFKAINKLASSKNCSVPVNFVLPYGAYKAEVITTFEKNIYSCISLDKSLNFFIDLAKLELNDDLQLELNAVIQRLEKYKMTSDNLE
jgi:hypothetical protein